MNSHEFTRRLEALHENAAVAWDRDVVSMGLGIVETDPSHMLVVRDWAEVRDKHKGIWSFWTDLGGRIQDKALGCVAQTISKGRVFRAVLIVCEYSHDPLGIRWLIDSVRGPYYAPDNPGRAAQQYTSR